MQRQIAQLKNKLQNLSDDGWELINVLLLPVKAWIGTVVSTYCLKSIIVNSFN